MTLLTEENRNKYLVLLTGIAIGAMLGFIFGMFMGGSITSFSFGTPKPDPSLGYVRIDALSTTLIGCFITIGFVVVYLYLTEWSKRNRVPKETANAKGAE